MGDYIVEIGGHDSKYFTQAQILEKIRTSMNTLDLKIITPMQSYNSTNKPVYITFLLCLQHSVRHIILFTIMQFLIKFTRAFCHFLSHCVYISLWIMLIHF